MPLPSGGQQSSTGDASADPLQPPYVRSSLIGVPSTNFVLLSHVLISKSLFLCVCENVKVDGLAVVWAQMRVELVVAVITK